MSKGVFLIDLRDLRIDLERLKIDIYTPAGVFLAILGRGWPVNRARGLSWPLVLAGSIDGAAK